MLYHERYPPVPPVSPADLSVATVATTFAEDERPRPGMREFTLDGASGYTVCRMEFCTAELPEGFVDGVLDYAEGLLRKARAAPPPRHPIGLVR